MEMGPTFSASVTMLLIIPVAFVLFSTMKPGRAAAWMAIGGTFYLPEGGYLRIKLLPVFTKANLPYVAICLAGLVVIGNRIAKNRPFFGPELIAFLIVLTALGTAMTNTDPLTFGSWIINVLPGLTIKDGVFIGLSNALRWGASFMAGRLIFQSREDLHHLVKVMLAVALVYTLWILVEIKMSPQMHVWAYGYRAHPDFLQTLRWGGYRPSVFMYHGLNLSMAMLGALLFAAAASRAKFNGIPFNLSRRTVLIYLAVILVFVKSTATILYGLLLVPLVLRASPKLVVRVAQAMTLIVVFYALLRANDWVPADSIVEYAMSINQERALSLKTRFDNETILLEKARERFLFGWGTYGRHTLYDEIVGTKTIAITDGEWIILVTVVGVLGLLSAFLPVVISVVISGQRILKMKNSADQSLLLGLLVTVSISMFDLIPNSMANPLRVFIAGALLNLSGTLLKEKRAPGEADAGQQKRRGRSRKVPRQYAGPYPGGSPYAGPYAAPYAGHWPPAVPPQLPPVSLQDEDQLFEPSASGESSADDGRPPSSDPGDRPQASFDDADAPTILDGDHLFDPEETPADSDAPADSDDDKKK